MSERKGLISRIFGKQSGGCCGSIQEMLSEPAKPQEQSSQSQAKATSCCGPSVKTEKAAAAR